MGGPESGESGLVATDNGEGEGEMESGGAPEWMMPGYFSIVPVLDDDQFGRVLEHIASMFGLSTGGH